MVSGKKVRAQRVVLFKKLPAGLEFRWCSWERRKRPTDSTPRKSAVGKGACGKSFNSLEARSWEGGKRAVDSTCETVKQRAPARTHIKAHLREIETWSGGALVDSLLS